MRTTATYTHTHRERERGRKGREMKRKGTMTTQSMHQLLLVTLPLQLLLLLASELTKGTQGFYIPGVHPVDFRDGDPVSPRVGRVSSVRKHVPYDYYDLPMCKPADGIKNFEANIGEVLR